MLLAGTLAGTLNMKLTFEDERLNRKLVFNDERSHSHKRPASMTSNLLEAKSDEVHEHSIKEEEQMEQTVPKKHKKQLLEECQIVLDLPLLMDIKEKQELKKKILDNGGTLSYIVTRKSNIVISNGQEVNSIKQKMAKKYGVPLVMQSYIDKCIMEQQLLDIKEFLLSSGLKADGFNKGKIRADPSTDSSLFLRPKSISAASLTAYSYDDLHGYVLVKAVLLKGRSFHKTGINTKFHFYVLELHSASGEKDIDASKKFCVFTDEGYLDKEKNGSIISSKKQCYYLEAADDALSVYSQLYFSKCGQPHCMIEAKEVLHPSLGTPEFQKLQLEWSTTLVPVSKDVLNLVDIVWMEAIGHLNQYLAISPENIPLWKVDEAEGILLQISTISAREKWQELAERLSVEFYSILPHKSEYEKPIVTKKLLSQKQDLCQVLRDMVSVSEASGWFADGHLQAKYRALRCHIEGLTPNTEEYEKIEQFLIQSQLHATGICIQTIYGIHRYLEAAEFSHHLPNKQLLFHATAPSNLVGILSQGLNLPKVVVQERGIERFDIGMLGGGIYFTDSLSTCIKYSRISKERGTRFLLVSEVALGKIYETSKFETSFTAPPHGFDSVHGVKMTETAPSEFQDDEFVIYKPCQQRMHYLVEFTLPEDQIKPFRVICRENDSDNIEQDTYSLELKDIKEEPKAETKARLQGRNSYETVDVPLKEVHVRAKLLDLVAQVVVFQEYKNLNESTLECKYVFPLERNAAVCGFEAFINNKHVVGKIKRKEVAHKEYKEAISKGHGAYLMDEESPDIFTVSVGNIPPLAVVIIKITYILELPVNDEVITFSIPTSVAPWIEHQALHQVTQDIVDSVAVEGSCNYSIQISMEMPFPINTISSPTHEILMKRTETTAVIRANPKMGVSDGFILLINLKEIHVPRMWTEIHEEKESSQASMLVFYPEFEVAQSQLSEIIIVLDASNSMRGDTFQSALQTALLCLMVIPDNCYFNIVAFGTVFQELFPTSHLCNANNIKKAKAFLKNVMPSLGNTELFHLLRYYQLTAGRLTKNVIIISDGHINNEGAVLRNAKSHCAKVRLFACGVSSTANKHMLCQLACWGGGAFEYMDPTDKSKWKSKAKTQIDRAMQAALANVRIEWQSFNDNSSFLQAPQQITSIFNGCRQVVYGFVPDCALAKLIATIDGEEYQTIVSNSTLNVPVGTMLHTLAARAVIRDWEDGLLAVDRANHLAERKLKEEQIVELSKEYNLVTSITSFIAIEERDKNEDFTDDGLRLMELLTDEDVDILNYMDFETLAKGSTRQYAGIPVSDDMLSEDCRSIMSSLSQSSDEMGMSFMDVCEPADKSSISSDSRSETRSLEKLESLGAIDTIRLRSKAFRRKSAFAAGVDAPKVNEEKEVYTSARSLEKPESLGAINRIHRRSKAIRIKSAFAAGVDAPKVNEEKEVYTSGKYLKCQNIIPVVAAKSQTSFRSIIKKSADSLDEDHDHIERDMPFVSNEPSYSYTACAPESSPEIVFDFADEIFSCQELPEKDFSSPTSRYRSTSLQRKRKPHLKHASTINRAENFLLCVSAHQNVINVDIHEGEGKMKDCKNTVALYYKKAKRLSKQHKLKRKEEPQQFPSVDPIRSPKYLQNMKDIKNYMKDLLKCKGGLPLCNAVDRHIRVIARKANNYDVIRLIDGGNMKCQRTGLEELEDFDFWDNIYPNSEKIENFKTLIEKIAIDGYCEEDDCLELDIVTERFTPKLEDTGLKSLGIKVALDIKRMLATLAVVIYLTSHLLAHVKEDISGQQEIQKLENLSQLLAFCLVEYFPLTSSLLVALHYIRNTEQNHPLIYRCLNCGNNWEMFINDYIKKPPAIPSKLSWNEIADNADVSMCYVVSE